MPKEFKMFDVNTLFIQAQSRKEAMETILLLIVNKLSVKKKR